MDTISVSIDRNSTITEDNKKINGNETTKTTISPFDFKIKNNSHNSPNRSCGSLELSKSQSLLDSEKKPKSFLAKICCCFYKA